MSRQLEKKLEERQARERADALFAVYGGLSEAVGRAGGELHGLSFNFRAGDTLMVIKARFPSGRQVAFVGSEDMVGCLIKGVRLGRRDELQWRADQWGEK